LATALSAGDTAVIAEGVGEAVAQGGDSIAEVASLTTAKLAEDGNVLAVSETIGNVAGKGSVTAAGNAIVESAAKNISVTASALADAFSDTENGKATA